MTKNSFVAEVPFKKLYNNFLWNKALSYGKPLQYDIILTL